MFIVTKAWIHQHKTERGGWTIAQIKALEMAWPLRRGWMDDIDGVAITDDQKTAFEAAAVTFRPVTLRKLRKELQPIVCPHCGAMI